MKSLDKRKYCRRCKLTKPFSAFGKNKKAKNGLSSWCKNCKNIYALTYRKRPAIRKNRYGLRKEDYVKLWGEQKGKCAICGKPESELDRPLVIDHNHTTKKVRGLLCYRCNYLLGAAWDSVIILRRAIEYLKQDNFGEVELLAVELAEKVKF